MRVRRPGLVIGVAAIMSALYGVDQWLAHLEARELGLEAQRAYDTGQRLAARGRYADAVDSFQKAHALQRANRDYEIAFAAAQISAAQFSQAHATLDELLQLKSNGAHANLLLARLLRKEGRLDEATAYYHRAIYGTWMRDGESGPVQTRLELAELLAQRGAKRDLLAELLPLEAETANNPAVARRLPELFLKAGSDTRAVETYRALIRRYPDESDLYAGLGRAELSQGNFHAAHTAFREALQLKPSEASLIEETQTATEAMALDPFPRGLTSADKYERAGELLRRAESGVKACSQTAEALDLITAADKLTAHTLSGAPSNEAAESRISLAEKIWEARSRLCAQTPVGDEPLDLVMRKLAQPSDRGKSL